MTNLSDNCIMSVFGGIRCFMRQGKVIVEVTTEIPKNGLNTFTRASCAKYVCDDLRMPMYGTEVEGYVMWVRCYPEPSGPCEIM